MRYLTFLADIFPLAGFLALLFSFLSPVPWSTGAAMELRPYVAPEGYLPGMACAVDTNRLFLAALLNNTNSHSDTNTTVFNKNALNINDLGTMQKVLLKGNLDEDDGGILGDTLNQLISAVINTAINGVGDDLFQIAPHGNFDEHPNATVRVWLGPLGSCTRDLDGRKWCTKSSYRHPNYNISSFIEPNPYLYPAIIQAQTVSRTTLAFLILAGIACLLSFLGNIDAGLNGVPIFYNIIVLIAEFVTLWVWFSHGYIESAPGSTNPRQINGLNRFFICDPLTGEVELKAGMHFYLLMGSHYGILWMSWILVYVLGTIGSTIRAQGEDSNLRIRL